MGKICNPFVLIFVVLAAISCSKSFQPSEGLEDSGSDVFIATIENGTKTTLSPNNEVFWIDNDQISVNGVVFNATVDATNKSIATFTKANQGGANPVPTYRAYYPASLFSGTGNPSLPVSQEYSSTNILQATPMFAQSEVNALAFKNICGLLKITVPITKTVNSIEVSSDKVMTGEFTVGSNYIIQMEDDPTPENKVVTLTCGNTWITGTDFFVAVPPQTYGFIKITLNTAGGPISKQTTASSVTINRNKIYSVEIDEYIDGLYFTETEFGQDECGD